MRCVPRSALLTKGFEHPSRRRGSCRASERPPPDRSLVLHAVYSRLMKHSHIFVMDSHNFISPQEFYVRPRAQVGHFNRVWHLMYYHVQGQRARQGIRVTGQGYHRRVAVAASTSCLGPDDFYPTDLPESIRHDFGQLPVYTIDDNGAQELEDDNSIEHPSSFWVHVHVADPTAILPPTHSIARRARDSVYTIYFNHGSRIMLPESHVKNKLSLGNAASSGQAENATTFSDKDDPSCAIVDYRLRTGIIRNVHILRYDGVDVAIIPLS